MKRLILIIVLACIIAVFGVLYTSCQKEETAPRIFTDNTPENPTQANAYLHFTPGEADLCAEHSYAYEYVPMAQHKGYYVIKKVCTVCGYFDESELYVAPLN